MDPINELTIDILTWRFDYEIKDLKLDYKQSYVAKAFFKHMIDAVYSKHLVNQKDIKEFEKHITQTYNIWKDLVRDLIKDEECFIKGTYITDIAYQFFLEQN